MQNFLTVDVEDYFSAEALAAVAPRDRWDSLPSRVEHNTHRLLEMFAARGLRGTFFVLGWVAQRYPGLVRDIVRAGHEVACHGLSHQLVYKQTPAAFRAESERARKLLQDTSGQPVEGYRAASFSITTKSLWALEVLVELGFEYDSSIFPVRHDLYGIPSSPVAPYLVRTNAGDLVEIPLSTIGFAGLRIPASGGGYFRLFPTPLAMWLLGAVNRDHRAFVFYMHPWEIDPDQPRFDVGLKSRIRHYTNLGNFQSRLELLLDRFQFTSMDECARSVRSRSGIDAIDVSSLA